MGSRMGQLDALHSALFQSPAQPRAVVFFSRRSRYSLSLNASQGKQGGETMKPLSQPERLAREEKVSQVMPKIRLYTPGAEEGEDGEFYNPKGGDIVLGMVVSGNASVLDIDIGARKLGMMFTRDMTPFDRFKVEDRLWGGFDGMKTPPSGKACLVKYEEVASGSGGELIVDAGTVLQLVVMGKTLSGSALLSVRNLYRPVAWQRVRDIFNADGVIQVSIESYNTGGLICRIEGLTAFLPKDMIQNMPRDLTGLKDYVGKRLEVMILLVEESKTRVLVSERAAWVQRLAPPYSLVEGTVTQVFSYGVLVKLDGADLSAMLHVSSISSMRITRVADVFSEGDKVKAVVMRPRFLDKVVLSTAVLEREKGLMLKDKEKVFREAEEAFLSWQKGREKYVDEIREANKPLSSEEARAAELQTIANIGMIDFERDGL